jgi:hypothetical protein
VLTYSGANIVEPACRKVPLTRQMVGEDGVVADADAREEIARSLAELAGAGAS